MMPRAAFGGNFHFLARGDFAGLLLNTLKEKPMHGYELMKAMEDRFQGFYKPSPGAIYPALRSLQRRGLVAVAGRERRKVYRITPQGRTYLKATRQEFRARFEELAKRLGPERTAMFREFRQTGRVLATNLQNVTPEQARDLQRLMVEMRERIIRILAR